MTEWGCDGAGYDRSIACGSKPLKEIFIKKVNKLPTAQQENIRKNEIMKARSKTDKGGKQKSQQKKSNTRRNLHTSTQSTGHFI